ncbi:MAG: sigma-54-dependent Fis family transcriptional regulator, partial [Deltaproteobacteria bacterium]|nr:sigma-54-dependent Fis family transcriptional regulator [Deltaproteobacteria bacterium]
MSKIPAIKILAADDHEESLFALENLLTLNGYEVVRATNGQEAWQLAKSQNPDLALLDVAMPGLDGYQVTKAIKDHPLLKYIPVILVTSKDDLKDVLYGFEQGADDYIKKPYRKEELLSRLRAAMRTRAIYRELQDTTQANRELRRAISAQHSFGSIVGESLEMQAVYSLIEKVAPSDVPVLITGESGTGKELVAKALHSNSPRCEEPFIVQNCSAFNDSLLESELFGHVRGAFTGALRDKRGLFEAADHGTFFLDEVGEMSPSLQAKLLRVLQDGSFISVGSTSIKNVNVRVIAATNRDLQGLIAAGTFREDLYYRLNVVNIKLPPLRERKSDIPLLATHFLARLAVKQEVPTKSLTPEAVRALCDYAWPGNVRELQNEMARLMIMCGSEQTIRP